MLDKCSSRSVYLGVCPVLFAHYVKLRTVFFHQFSIQHIRTFIEDYNEHMVECLCGVAEKNGRWIVDTAFKISFETTFEITGPI